MTVDDWAQRVAADVMIAPGERAPLDPILLAHLDAFEDVARRTRLKIPAFARALTRAGLTLHSGAPYSATILRAQIGRARSKRKLVLETGAGAAKSESERPSPSVDVSTRLVTELQLPTTPVTITSEKRLVVLERLESFETEAAYDARPGVKAMDPGDYVDGLRKARANLVKTIGVDHPERFEDDLKIYIGACLRDLENASRDAPRPIRQENSHNSTATKNPSPNFSDIEQELQEFQKWLVDSTKLKGGGRRPRLRSYLSLYALKVMLAGGPIGDRVTAREKWDVVERPGSVRYPRQTWIRQRSLERMELLSNQEEIFERQSNAFQMARGDSGEPLVGYIVGLAFQWPRAFLDLVESHLDTAGDAHLPVKLLEMVLSGGDRTKMARGIELALDRVRWVRENRDPRSKMTMSGWAGSDPMFMLTHRMLTRVWPVERGIALPRLQLDELAGNLALWVQYQVDSLDRASQLRRTYGKPRSVLGGRPSAYAEDEGREITGELEMTERVRSIVKLVSARRFEDVAYYWARHTIASILQGIYRTDNAGLRAAAAVVSGVVVAKLDARLELRRRLLRFGSDKPQGAPLKWFGGLDASARETSGNERTIAGRIFPRMVDKFALLGDFGKMIGGLNLNGHEMGSWRQVAGWAAGPGSQSWDIDPADPTNYLMDIWEQVLGPVNAEQDTSL